MEMFHNAVSWVEIPVVDFDRAKKFYSAIFDYDMAEMPMGPMRMGFLLHDQQNGGIGGAIIGGDENNSPSKTGPRVYLNGGTDLNIVLNRVESAGGKVVLPKMEISPEYGFCGGFEDTEGNHVFLHSMS